MMVVMMVVVKMVTMHHGVPTWQGFIVEENVHLLDPHLQGDELDQVDAHILRFHLVGNVAVVDHDLQLPLPRCMHIN